MRFLAAKNGCKEIVTEIHKHVIGHYLFLKIQSYMDIAFNGDDRSFFVYCV